MKLFGKKFDKSLKSLILLIVVICLGTFTYFFVYTPEELGKQKETEERRLVQFDIDNITSFTLARPESSIVFERGLGRVWNITEPLKSEVEKEVLYNLFSFLDQSQILYTPDENPENLKVYGLENPEYYMAMNYLDGSQDTLFIGSNSPDEFMTYVKYASENRVLTAQSVLTILMKQSAMYYRSRTVLNIIKEDITSVDIDRGDDDKIIISYTGHNWIVRHPWEFRGDEGNIRQLISEIGDSPKITNVEERTDDLSQYGLDNPRVILRVSLKIGTPEKIILIGDQLKIKGGTHLSYAKQFDNDLIFTLENNLVKLLTYMPEWYIDKNPIKFNREITNKIILQTGGSSITFVKDSQGNWSTVLPVDKNLDKITINKIFAITRFVIIHDIIAYNPIEEDIVKTGIDKPNIIITFYRDDTMLDQIIYGNTYAVKDTYTYFRTSKTPIIYATRNSVVSEVNKVLRTVYGDY